jgi:AraC family transcriptional regulator of adaptative response/methylated-DNA-[protein]-cysteine methyltransferase
MLAIADEDALYLLELFDRRRVERRRHRIHAAIIPGSSPPIFSIERELSEYRAGTLDAFQTRICRLGTPFEPRVWEAPMTIPPQVTQTLLRR